jgi:hypothetical protein
MEIAAAIPTLPQPRRRRDISLKPGVYEGRILRARSEGLRYCPAIVAANGRIKPDWVFVDGKEARHPEGAYYIDYTNEDGKRIRTSVGKSASEAQAVRLRKEAELRALAQGLNVVSEDDEAEKNKRP